MRRLSHRYIAFAFGLCVSVLGALSAAPSALASGPAQADIVCQLRGGKSSQIYRSPSGTYYNSYFELTILNTGPVATGPFDCKVSFYHLRPVIWVVNGVPIISYQVVSTWTGVDTYLGLDPAPIGWGHYWRWDLYPLQPGDLIQWTYTVDLNNQVPESDERNTWSITF
jgi:hypothetical protein